MNSTTAINILLILCVGATALFGAIDKPVRVESGLLSGVTGLDASVRGVQRRPICGATRRHPALARRSP